MRNRHVKPNTPNETSVLADVNATEKGALDGVDSSHPLQLDLVATFYHTGGVHNEVD